MVDKRRGYIPDGQTSRGTESFESKNPKNASARRRDGLMPDAGDSGQVQRSHTAGTTGRSTDYGRSTFDRGSKSSVPDPNIINTTTTDALANVPSAENVSAYRSYNVDPVELPSPGGDTRTGVNIPRYGKGTD